jgi:hypothetical protein
MTGSDGEGRWAGGGGPDSVRPQMSMAPEQDSYGF